MISQAVYWQISDKYRALITLNQRKTSQEIRKTVRKGAITGKQVAADDTRLNIRHLL